jgi:hypothetical protein
LGAEIAGREKALLQLLKPVTYGRRIAPEAKFTIGPIFAIRFDRKQIGSGPEGVGALIP